MPHAFSNGLSPRRTGFGSRLVHVEFMVDKVAQGHVLLYILRFPLVGNISISVLHTLSSLTGII
jgi:hypothetical protein